MGKSWFAYSRVGSGTNCILEYIDSNKIKNINNCNNDPSSKNPQKKEKYVKLPSVLDFAFVG